MPDLKATYLGLQLKNPLVASASPLSKKVANVRRLEDAGAAAVVMYSLFEREFCLSQADQAARRACSSRCKPGFLS